MLKQLVRKPDIRAASPRARARNSFGREYFFDIRKGRRFGPAWENDKLAYKLRAGHLLPTMEFSMRLPKAALLLALLVLPQSAGAADRDWYLLQPRNYVIGTGAVAGLPGNQVVHATGPMNIFGYAALRREISLADWRGKRLRISLSLKDTPDARSWVSAVIWNADHSAIVSSNLRNKAGSDDWQTHGFVLDVPRNADRLVISVGMRGENSRKNGTVWVDGATLQAVGDDIALTYSRHLRTNPYTRDDWLDLGMPGESWADGAESAKGLRVTAPRGADFPPISVRGRE